MYSVFVRSTCVQLNSYHEHLFYIYFFPLFCTKCSGGRSIHTDTHSVSGRRFLKGWCIFYFFLFYFFISISTANYFRQMTWRRISCVRLCRGENCMWKGIELVFSTGISQKWKKININCVSLSLSHSLCCCWKCVTKWRICIIGMSNIIKKCMTLGVLGSNRPYKRY